MKTCLSRKNLVYILGALVLWSAANLLAADLPEGSELIGTRAPDWVTSIWLNSEPKNLSDFKGKVVLVRFWTGPGCPFCSASSPVLNDLYSRYQKAGLVVVGLYHHKSPESLTKAHVERLTEKFRFEFPIAIDPEWKTLKKWWLDGRERAWTSVSFLIDRQGVIRYIHPGGSYTTEEAKELEGNIISLLDRAP